MTTVPARRTTAGRLLLLAAVLVSTDVLLGRIVRPPPATAGIAAQLHGLPFSLGKWRGHDTAPFGPDVLAQLGVDDYINRIYVDGDAPVALYIGYYGSQQAGNTMHSPQNCLPGSGWLPVVTSRIEIPVAGRAAPIVVSHLLIQKGRDRQVVLYWYQSRGRIVASDYWSKAYLVYDAARFNRSDAAMVRIISPTLPGEPDHTAAEARAVAFLQSAFSQIDRRLPI